MRVRQVSGKGTWKLRVTESQSNTNANKAMHAELAAVPSSLYYVTRANRVIAGVST